MENMFEFKFQLCFAQHCNVIVLPTAARVLDEPMMVLSAWYCTYQAMYNRTVLLPVHCTQQTTAEHIRW